MHNSRVYLYTNLQFPRVNIQLQLRCLVLYIFDEVSEACQNTTEHATNIHCMYTCFLCRSYINIDTGVFITVPLCSYLHFSHSLSLCNVCFRTKDGIRMRYCLIDVDVVVFHYWAGDFLYSVLSFLENFITRYR